jgi:signal transduction histidine kinase
MFNLTRKNRIALQFSALNSILIILTIFSFAAIIYFYVNNSIKEALIAEAEEIITNHISIENERIIYKIAADGTTIEQDLVSDQASAIIYNSKLESIGNFGIFEIKQDMMKTFTENNPENLNIIKEVQLNKKSQFTSKIKLYAENNYEILTYPIVKGNATYGVVQVAIKTKQIDQLTSVAGTILLIILPISLLLSYILAQLFAYNAFKPIVLLLEKMHEIHGKNLKQRVEIEGAPNDEIVQLGSTFNEMLSRIDDFTVRQENFVSNASHELKTPLTRAISTLEAVEYSITDKDVKDSISDTKQDLFDLNSIIQSLLYLARVSNTEKLKQIKFDSYDLKDSVNLLVRRYDEPIKSKKLKIEVFIPPVKVFFPKEYLDIIIVNLISNAIKYSFENSIIKISSKIESSKVSISISDQGIGMSEVELKKVYDRFYRSDSGVKFAEGSGLGMSVVKSICNAFDLDMNISSQKDQGTFIEIKGINVS